MSRDLVKPLTVKSLVAMKKIVDNWVNDENFANTAQSKKMTIALQNLLYGLAEDDKTAAAHGMTLIEEIVTENFNLKK